RGMRAELAQCRRPAALGLAQEIDGAIEPDREDLLERAQALVGALMLDVRAETADAGGDRLARLGVVADLARQREKLQGECQAHLLGLHSAREGDALRLLAAFSLGFSLGFFLGLALRLARINDVGAGLTAKLDVIAIWPLAQRHGQTRGRIAAE